MKKILIVLKVPTHKLLEIIKTHKLLVCYLKMINYFNMLRTMFVVIINTNVIFTRTSIGILFMLSKLSLKEVTENS